MTKINNKVVIKALQSDQSLTLADVGRDMNLSRERIRQIADGIPGASRHKMKRFCSECNKEIKQRRCKLGYAIGLCQEHWDLDKIRRRKERKKKEYTWFTCEICGCRFPRYSRIVKYINRTKRLRIRFCSKRCQAINMVRKRYG